MSDGGHGAGGHACEMYLYEGKYVNASILVSPFRTTRGRASSLNRKRWHRSLIAILDRSQMERMGWRGHVWTSDAPSWIRDTESGEQVIMISVEEHHCNWIASLQVPAVALFRKIVFRHLARAIAGSRREGVRAFGCGSWIRRWSIYSTVWDTSPLLWIR
jgi:hypothetical protein